MPVTNEEVKQIVANNYMDHIRGLKGRIEFRKNEVEEMKINLDVAGVNYENITSGNVSRDSLPEGVVKLIEYIDMLDADLNSYQEEMGTAISVIESLPPDVEDIARKHYIDNISWAHLERTTNYSHTSMMRKRRRILLLVYELMPEDWRRKLPKAI